MSGTQRAMPPLKPSWNRKRFIILNHFENEKSTHHNNEYTASKFHALGRIPKGLWGRWLCFPRGIPPFGRGYPGGSTLYISKEYQHHHSLFFL
jgi:hypothetical protein